MEEKKFTKLSALVDGQFTVEKAWGFSFKKWEPESRRMLVEDRWTESMRGDRDWKKVYSLDTDKGKLDISASQLGSLLEACYDKGVSDINKRTFSVKSNGKTGMDIRYYLNLVREPKNSSQDVSMDDLPPEWS